MSPFLYNNFITFVCIYENKFSYMYIILRKYLLFENNVTMTQPAEVLTKRTEKTIQ